MRIKRSVNALKKRRKVLKLAKGYTGSRSRLYRVAKTAVAKAGNYAFIGRRLKKRDMRTLWIARINAACRLNDISYSRFMHGLKANNIDLNRKVLADLAVSDAPAFAKLCETAKKVK
ncbi:MAG: 50S ribosomal protein L20 [Clostridiales bacterium]|nr:50S ribosomal protein L20 [Candidatus Apopatousia equi]